jgi:hypothetical protein
MTTYFIHILIKSQWDVIHMFTTNKVVFCSIKGSTIKRYILIDMLIGSGVYYIIYFISSSFLLGMTGSYIGTEAMKGIHKLILSMRGRSH